ncbi:MAG: metallophosphoesterase [Lachnospiraceae bacterium]|nr:metallophosphoesterase [Lachnospiraceae bacterium]
MMIFITGDCHLDYGRFKTRIFWEQKEMTKEDYVIICGDFGGVWNKDKESREETHLMDWLEEKPFTTLFVDGNHENFDRLDAYPVEEWHGGKVHKIRASVIHLMRGQVFEIDGKSFFTFGGASSHDISGGILEPDDPDFRLKKKKLDMGYRPYRINHLSWWSRELPTEEEMEEGRKNLAKYNHTVDYVVTHCCATSTQFLLGGSLYKADVLTDYLEEIRQNTKFKNWFFGHYHDNQNVNTEEILLYEQIIRIA